MGHVVVVNVKNDFVNISWVGSDQQTAVRGNSNGDGCRNLLNRRCDDNLLGSTARCDVEHSSSIQVSNEQTSIGGKCDIDSVGE